MVHQRILAAFLGFSFVLSAAAIGAEQILLAEARKKPTIRRKEKTRSQPVDLSNLDSRGKVSKSSSRFYDQLKGQKPTSGAKFKTYFDISFVYQPNAQPLSFENFHTVFLVDYVPRPNIQFSIGIAPPQATPRS